MNQTLRLLLISGLLVACDSDGGGHQLDAVDATTDAVADTVDVDVSTDVDAEPHPALVGTVPATFTVRPGVETVTVLDATPGAPITLYDSAGERLVTVVADLHGQAHFAYVAPTHQVLDLTLGSPTDLARDGRTLAPGADYVLRDDSPAENGEAPAASEAFTVLAVADTPDVSFYEAQVLTGSIYTVVGPGDDELAGFNYIRMRDGVELSAMVRLPDPNIWGDGPYPTVIEYSGYSPSRPGNPEPGSRIATLLGFASVGVNMRGTGCSGGVFDVFNPAQHADGYDVVEVVSRQDWVLGKVGMVGLSYSGIAQLFVASTRPPGLAAITPLSVIADPWEQLWPGGIYNDGFTRQWLAERDEQAAPNGQSWTDIRVADGDTRCEAHQDLRTQNFAFEDLFRQLHVRPHDADARSIPLLVERIDVPVYLTGAFQDEQTGGQFSEMLDRFINAPVTRFIVYNGRHPDGYSPLVITRWWEFLEIYVAGRVPRLPSFIRELAGPELAKEFGVDNVGFEPDRFTAFEDDDYAGVVAAYEAEAPVRALFENGAGHEEPGAPLARFEASFDAWPPPEAETLTFYLAADGALVGEAPGDEGADGYLHDPDAGEVVYLQDGYPLLRPLWTTTWEEFEDERRLSYLSAPMSEDVVLAGPAHAELWMTSDVLDVHVQVTLTEVRSDGFEYLLQSGWHRVAHRGLDHDRTGGARVAYTFEGVDLALLAPGEVVHTRVPIPSIGHALRAGSRLRVVISTPGRDHALWEFANPDDDPSTEHRVHRGGATPSALHLSVIDGVEVPEGYPPCPSLRGQPCRVWAGE